ncbi:MAG: hypothetical protein V3T78_08670, partial [Dehalococcoidia bacterium]
TGWLRYGPFFNSSRVRRLLSAMGIFWIESFILGTHHNSIDVAGCFLGHESILDILEHQPRR